MLIGRRIVGCVGLMDGVPYIHREFLVSFAKFVQYNERVMCQPNEELLYLHTDWSYHAAARNYLARTALECEAEWLFLMDCDQTFSANALDRLLRTMREGDGERELDVVTGIYHQKGSVCPPVLYRWDDGVGGFRLIGDYKAGAVFQVHSAGAGCLLAKADVLRRIGEELNEEPFTEAEGRSEDHSFFRRLMLLEPPVAMWADARVQCGHLQTVVIGEREHRRGVAELSMEWAEAATLQ